MILTLIGAAALVAPGPAMRLGPMTADGGATVDILDARGVVASTVLCPPNQWVDARDSARALMASTIVMANVVATDGRLDSPAQLGPARYACVIGAGHLQNSGDTPAEVPREAPVQVNALPPQLP